MNKKLSTLVLACSLMLGLSSCTSTQPLTATSNTVGLKEGRASSNTILGIIHTGNSGIDKAAKKAGIKKISHVDVKNTKILGGLILSKQTTIVYGE